MSSVRQCVRAQIPRTCNYFAIKSHRIPHRPTSKSKMSFSVSSPKPAFSKPLTSGSLRFVDVLDAKNRKPTFTFAGRLGSALLEYEGRYSFKLELGETDLDKVVKIDEFFDNPDNAESISLPDAYEHRSCLNIDNHLNIKLKEKNGAWAFKCNDASFDASSSLEPGDKVTVKVVPGFYFSEEDKRYGVYFSLKELVFPKKSGKKL